MKLSMLSVILMLYLSPVHAQPILKDTAAIKQYIQALDSNHSLVEAIAEGSIINRKNKRHIGGFGISYYETRKRDSICKISYHSNADRNVYRAFYFYQSKLIYASQLLEDWGQGTALFKEAFFFRADTSLAHIVYLESRHCYKRISKLKQIHMQAEGYRLLAQRQKQLEEERDF